MNRARIEALKDQYPPGTRIMLDSMGDDPRPIESGTMGTVKMVDDMGTLHCIVEKVLEMSHNSFDRLKFMK